MSQQIYIPLGGKYPIPYEFEADTMQVPRGEYSILSELEKGHVTSADAMVYLTLNHGSTWNSGQTWGLSTRYLSNILGIGMSRRYVRGRLNALTDQGWILVLDKKNPEGSQYRLRHHLCEDQDDVPVDRDGKPLKFAVPRGSGAPLERCFDGDISWKAALVWIVLKRRSNWKANEDTSGQTIAEPLLAISKRCRFSMRVMQGVITELTQAGMLERLSNQRQPAIFQLYPKPFPKPSAPRTEIRREWVKGREIKHDDEYWYSDNHQYRCPLGDAYKIERRQRGGTWKRVSDYHRAQVMPQAILRDFERAVEVHVMIKRSLSLE